MGARRSHVAVIAGLMLAPGSARADQEVELQLPGLKIQIPDAWVYQRIELADVFMDAGGGVVGRITIAPEECATAMSRFILGNSLENNGPIIDAFEGGWSGWNLSKGDEPLTLHCRDIVMVGTPLAALMEGYNDERATLLRAYSAGLDALVGAATTTDVVEAEPDAETRHEINLITLGFKIEAPTNWKSNYNEGYDWVSRGGKSVAKVAESWAVDCAATVETLVTNGGTVVKPLPGWSGAEAGGMGTYCHERTKAYVFVETAATSWFLAAVDAGLERRRINAIPTPFERFGPNRYEFGMGRFDADPNNLFVMERWGVAAAVGKTPWGSKPGLAWSYMARLLATGGGSPGSVDAGIGVNLKFLALQGIVGAGAAGDPAPLAVHAGAQLDLLVLKAPGGGFDFTASRVWFDGGHATRLGGAFLLAGSRRAYALSFGWDSRGGTSTFTFNLMTMRLPPSE